MQKVEVELCRSRAHVEAQSADAEVVDPPAEDQRVVDAQVERQ